MPNWWQSLSDFEQEALTGTEGDYARQAQNDQLWSNMRRAGGTEDQASAAVAEQNQFLQDYWPARSVIGTLEDDVTGDPLGIDRSKDGSALSNAKWDIVMLVAAIVVGLIVFSLIKG